MRLTGKSGLAIIFMLAGSLIVLSKLFGHGHVMGMLLPIILIGLGYVGLKNGKTFIGGVLILVGSFILLGKLFHFIGFLIAIGLIIYGVSLWRKRSKVYERNG